MALIARESVTLMNQYAGGQHGQQGGYLPAHVYPPQEYGAPHGYTPQVYGGFPPVQPQGYPPGGYPPVAPTGYPAANGSNSSGSHGGPGVGDLLQQQQHPHYEQQQPYYHQQQQRQQNLQQHHHHQCLKCGLNHEGSCGIRKQAKALSTYLIQHSNGLTRWTFGDFVRLVMLGKFHAEKGAEDTIDGDVVTSRVLLEKMLFGHHCATAAYELTEVLTPMLRDSKEKFVLYRHRPDADFKMPSYFIAANRYRKIVVLSCRGSFETADLLTDLVPDPEAFQGGVASKGMLHSARFLLNKEAPFLKELLTVRFPHYKLVLTGHSLGGAVVSLLTMILHAEPTTLGIPLTDIECWGYGCAPCVDKRLATDPRYNNIHNVVLQDDIVPRLHPKNVENLHIEMQEASKDRHSTDGTAETVVKNLVRVADKAVDKAIVKVGRLFRKVASSSAEPVQFLESPRLYVPGNLYHIKRNKLEIEERGPVALPEPCQPFSPWERVKGHNLKHKYHVIRGTVSSQRFGRIIVSLDAPWDHHYYSYRDALVDANERFS